jgi:hypothetical protein
MAFGAGVSDKLVRLNYSNRIDAEGPVEAKLGSDSGERISEVFPLPKQESSTDRKGGAPNISRLSRSMDFTENSAHCALRRRVVDRAMPSK